MDAGLNSHGVEQWVTIERESLDKVAGGSGNQEEGGTETEAIPPPLGGAQAPAQADDPVS
jgi:hypothetical protein